MEQRKHAILESAAVITNPGEKYAFASRKWQGCPTVAYTAGGRIWVGHMPNTVKKILDKSSVPCLYICKPLMWK